MNIAEILENYPSGTKLYSPICGECELISIDNGTLPITVQAEDRQYSYFTKEGKYRDKGECLLFPSKENRDWNTFNYAEPKYKMSEAVSENKNVSPLLYGSIDSKQRETLLKRLKKLYNNLGIDTEFNTPDYLLAEYTLNCLVSYGNTVAKNIEKGYIKPTLL